MSKPETVAVSPIPAGLHTVTPRLVVGDGAAAIYRQAFGAEEHGDRFTWAGPDGELIQCRDHDR